MAQITFGHDTFWSQGTICPEIFRGELYLAKMSLGSKGEGKSGAKMGNSQSSLSLLTFALLTKLRLSALCCSIKYAVRFFFMHSPVGHFDYKDNFDFKTWPLKNEKLGCFLLCF